MTSVGGSVNSLLLPVARQAQGSMDLPGSKSISNRVLLLAALSMGETVIEGLLDSDDTRVMIKALQTLGVDIEPVGPRRVRVAARKDFPRPAAELFLGNAGTAFRPMTAALAFLGGDYKLSGVARMHERPIADLVQALRSLGASIDYLGEPGFPPLHIRAGNLKGDRVSVNGSVSSQFLTALLLSAPVLVAQTRKPLDIEVVGELISKPYIEITLNMMRQFGVQVQRLTTGSGNLSFRVPATARYQSPGEINVEGDASSASYFLALGLIGQGPIQVRGVGANSIQGDVAFVETLRALGAQVEMSPNSIQVSGVSVAQGARLRAFDEDFNHIPDAAMTAAVLAIYADGPCRLRNIGSWRVKETDRIHAMQTELSKLGARVESGPDWLEVWPIASGQWRTASIHTYDDHRMAMCFSLATFGEVAVRIEDPNCVAKTFPDYFDQYAALVS
jgi:3-phosphoshikimate 1-carboxyvinyltransferase